MHQGNLEALDKALRDLWPTKFTDLANLLFGGIVVGFSGDPGIVPTSLPWRKTCVFVRRTTRARM